jgi:hypothetical protein
VNFQNSTTVILEKKGCPVSLEEVPSVKNESATTLGSLLPEIYSAGLLSTPR